MNTVSGWIGIYQSMVTNEQVFDANGAGLDLNNQRGQGEFDSRPLIPQPNTITN